MQKNWDNKKGSSLSSRRRSRHDSNAAVLATSTSRLASPRSDVRGQDHLPPERCSGREGAEGAARASERWHMDLMM